MRKKNLIKIRISFLVCFLFIEFIIISSGIIVLGESVLPFCHDKACVAPINDPICTEYFKFKFYNSSEDLISQGKIAHAYILYPGSSGESEGPCYFTLDEPGNIVSYYSGFPPVIVGGTWTNDGRWLGCEWDTNNIWEIDPETGYFKSIGGEGNGTLNGLAYNPVTEKLYGASSSNLYEVDIQTGQQDYIGPFNNGGQAIVGVAFDFDGILYAWDAKQSGDSYLYIVDITTGQATEVGSMGITLYYAQDGAFDYETDTLYLSAYLIDPDYGGYLIECDKDTGSCALIGPFEGSAEIAALAIPYNWSGPTANFTWTPTLPNPDETIFFDASESYDSDGYIAFYEWDWDNDGVYDENHTTPTTTHTWSNKGDYPVTLKITDNNGFLGMKTRTLRVGNQRPIAPMITGPTNGKVGVEYEYTFSLYDPDDDSTYLLVDWGDITSDIFVGPFESGKTIGLKHIWSEPGDFYITAQAVDIFGAKSDWSNFTVWITKNKAISGLPFLRFLERYPLLNLLLQKLIL